MLTRLAALAFLCASPAATHAQEHAHASPPPGRTPPPLIADLGHHSRRVTTSSADAQGWFDQGMRLTYGFALPEAQRAFREAARRDTSCAMCWWGLAWSLGPYINGPTLSSEAAAEASDASRRALALSSRATPVERALARAMALRHDSSGTGRARLDSAYADAMRDVARRFPGDLDAQALFAESMMVLRPWNQWTRDGAPQPGTGEVLRTLERALARDVRHPGACHYYIHATEASRDPGRAARCADLLGRAMPAASHMPHMPSHTYMRIGRYGDAVDANRLARLADQRARHGGAAATYAAHNLHMLASAATMDGQSAVAIQAATDLARMAPRAAYYRWATLARFGRWQELRDVAPPGDALRGAAPFARGMSHWARGMGRLGAGMRDSARASLDSLDGALRELPDSVRIGAHRARALLGIARGILAGELLAAGGAHDAAVDALHAAVALGDSLAYDEPEPWPLPPRHVLGAVLADAGRAAEAEATFREDLARHPANGWALAGLERALRLRGDARQADAIARELLGVWERADFVTVDARVRP